VKKACLLSSLLNGGRLASKPITEIRSLRRNFMRPLSRAHEKYRVAERSGSQGKGVSGGSGIAGTAKKSTMRCTRITRTSRQPETAPGDYQHDRPRKSPGCALESGVRAC